MLQQQLTKFRRDLHQIPELEMELPKTCAYIKSVLSDLPCMILSPIPYSVVAFFDAGKEESIAFRSDMDALPVKEQTGREFASRHEGCMHACGHDGHMAMLLGFAQELSTYYKELPHNVLLIFQPGEETPGGALPICETGILETYHVKHIFGFHLWPNLPAGTVATRIGEFMARASEVNIEVYGKSVHAAKYQEGIDALEIAAQYLLDLYRMEKEEIAPDVYRLLRFGKMESGTVRNVVSSKARIEGTLRSFQEDDFQYMKKRIYEIAASYEKTYGVNFQIDINSGYPAVINDSALCDKVFTAFDKGEIVIQKDPEMIAEDFAQYQQRVPGVFFFLGTGTGIALHAAAFDFDETILMKGVETYKRLSYID